MPPWGISDTNIKWVLTPVQPYCKREGVFMAAPTLQCHPELVKSSERTYSLKGQYFI